MKKEFSNQEYAEKVKKLTPKFSSFSNCWHAFVSGGAICVLGELIRQIAYNRVGVSEENSYIVVSVCLASPAIEYQKEGQVFGIGVKIFTIAGPVILYGVFTSWVIGCVYWIFFL